MTVKACVGRWVAMACVLWIVSAAPAARIETAHDEKAGTLRASIDGKEAFTFFCGADLDLPYIVPRSPSGKAMTVVHPAKYPHHRSLWFADKVQLAGKRTVIFYNALYSRADKNDPNSPFVDRVRLTELKPPSVEGDSATIDAKLLWEMDRNVPVLDEVLRMRLTALGGGEYLLDMTFTLTASYGEVAFVSDSVHYAWPYVRMTPAFSVDQGGRITNSEGGVDQKGTHGQVAKWVDYSNTIDGTAEGLAMLSHSANPQPHKWLTRDYGTFGPRRIDARSGKKFTLNKGQSIETRVALLVHKGDVTGGKVARRYAAYAGGAKGPVGAAGPAGVGPVAKIAVSAGKHERTDTPVSVSLKGVAGLSGREELRLEEVTGGRRRPVVSQLIPGDEPRLSWILTGRTAAGTSRAYELVSGEPVKAAGSVNLNVGEKALEITCGGTKVLRYNHATVPAPKGQSKLYDRSGFIHPLWSPGGAVLTGIHPGDHYHHLGLWHPWTKTKFEGRSVDFWNLKAGNGTMRFKEWGSVASGPVFGAFRAIQEHVDLSAPGGEKVVLTEKFDVRVWNAAPKDAYWLMDYTTTQRCASQSPLELAQYRYGGFGFRATTEWNKDNSDYLTSEGKTRKDGHATRARWCITQGKTSKGEAGIVFLSHPENYEHPEPMRIWPQGPIFFNFCPIQKKARTLEPGNDYVLKYRLCIFHGKADARQAERVWRDFAEPPAVKLAR